MLADDFTAPHLHHSQHDAEHVEFLPGIRLWTRPFPGTVGVAPAEPGTHSVVPPRPVGGNLDVRDLVAGTTVRASVSGTLTEADDHCARPSLSSDGSHVGFHSEATNLDPDDFNGVSDVFLHEIATGTKTGDPADDAALDAAVRWLQTQTCS